MTATTFALIVSAVGIAVSAVAAALALAAIRRAPLPGNGPMAPPGTTAHAGATFHDVALIASMQGMLSHGDTHDRNPIYISSRAKSIADQMVQVRRST